MQTRLARTGALLGAFAALAAPVARSASAAVLKGQVTIPAASSPAPAVDRSTTPAPLAYWRVENGVVPPAPAPEAHEPIVVVLEPLKLPEGEPPGVLIEAKALRLEPRLVVAQQKATVTIRNADKVPRTFYLRRGEEFLPRETTPPGASRERKFSEFGSFDIDDADYPHGGARLLVVNSPYSTRADEKGAFSFDVPEGKYILRVWWRGSWNEGQSIEVGRTREVTVRFVPARGASERK